MRITLVGAVANCLLTIAKIAAGIVGKSAAMVADGVHSLSDLISDFVVVGSINSFFSLLNGQNPLTHHSAAFFSM